MQFLGERSLQVNWINNKGAKTRSESIRGMFDGGIEHSESASAIDDRLSAICEALPQMNTNEHGLEPEQEHAEKTENSPTHAFTDWQRFFILHSAFWLVHRGRVAGGVQFKCQ